MDVKKEIEAVKELLDGQIAGVPENSLEEQYKSRNVNNYAAALRTLLEIQRGEGKGVWRN